MSNIALNDRLTVAYRQLDGLSSAAKRVFAASCCERMIPNYQTYDALTGVGSMPLLRGFVNLLWHHSTDAPKYEVIQSLQQRLDHTRWQDNATLWSHLALLAWQSVREGLSIIEPAYQAYTRVEQNIGRYALQTAYDYVWWTSLPNALISADKPQRTALSSVQNLGGDLIAYTHQPNAVDKYDNWVAASPLVQAEIAHQARDVEMLAEHGIARDTVKQLREWSRYSGVQPLNRRLIDTPLTAEQLNAISF